jgi:hypothetical protein
VSVRPSAAAVQVTESGIHLPGYDYVLNTTPGTDTMTLVFRVGGSGGTIVAHVTIVFTDSSHTDLISVTSTQP